MVKLKVVEEISDRAAWKTIYRKVRQLRTLLSKDRGVGGSKFRKAAMKFMKEFIDKYSVNHSGDKYLDMYFQAAYNVVSAFYKGDESVHLSSKGPDEKELGSPFDYDPVYRRLRDHKAKKNKRIFSYGVTYYNW